MAAFGSGVNPSLGAINYNAYSQGAAQGSAAVGRGIEALGEAAGTAIKDYYKKKETNEIVDATTVKISDALKANPAFGRQLGISDPNDAKAIKIGIKAIGGGDAMKGAQITSQMLSQLQAQETENQAYRAATSSAIAPGRAVQQYISSNGSNPMAFAQAQGNQAYQQAQIRSLDAEAQARIVPKPQEGTVMTAEQLKKLNEAGMDYTGTPLSNGSFLVSKVSPFAPMKPTIEPGYEPDPAKPGAVRPIEGGSAANAIAEKKNKFDRSVSAAQLKAKNIIEIGNEIFPKIDNLTAGVGGFLLAKLPQTAANDLKQQLDTIEANIGFDRLQEMRENSPTGGALGNVSNTELELLTKSWRSLKQSQTPDQLRSNLASVLNHYNRFLGAVSGIDPDANPEQGRGQPAGSPAPATKIGRFTVEVLP